MPRWSSTKPLHTQPPRPERWCLRPSRSLGDRTMTFPRKSSRLLSCQSRPRTATFAHPPGHHCGPGRQYMALCVASVHGGLPGPPTCPTNTLSLSCDGPPSLRVNTEVLTPVRRLYVAAPPTSWDFSSCRLRLLLPRLKPVKGTPLCPGCSLRCALWRRPPVPSRTPPLSSVRARPGSELLPRVCSTPSTQGFPAPRSMDSSHTLPRPTVTQGYTCPGAQDSVRPTAGFRKHLRN